MKPVKQITRINGFRLSFVAACLLLHMGCAGHLHFKEGDGRTFDLDWDKTRLDRSTNQLTVVFALADGSTLLSVNLDRKIGPLREWETSLYIHPTGPSAVPTQKLLQKSMERFMEVTGGLFHTEA